MTIPFYNARRVVQNNGAVSTIAVTFRAEAASDVHVYAGITTEPTAEGIAELTQGVHYSVSGIGLLGYTVTITDPSAWDDYDVFAVFTDYPVTQPNDVDVGGPFGKRFEDALDRQTFMLQSFKDQVDRSLRLPVTSPVDTDTVMYPLPGGLISWNDEGTAIISREPGDFFATKQQGANADLALSFLEMLALPSIESFTPITNLVAGQTVIPVPGGYAAGVITDVHLNGSQLVPALDYNANDGVNIVLFSAITEADLPAVLTGQRVTTVAGLAALDLRYNAPGFRYDSFRSLLTSAPYSYTVETGKFPPAGPNMSIYIAPGGHLEGAVGLNRSTIMGVQAVASPVNLDRVDVFGSGALRRIKVGQRISAFGTIAGESLGMSKAQVEAEYSFWNQPGGVKPGDVGWNPGNMEVENPGIGARLAAFNGYASTSEDIARVALFARDALNGTVVATDTVAFGYRAGASLFAVNGTTVVGVDALRGGIFHDQADVFGFQAANLWREGRRNTVIGRGAGLNTRSGENNVLLGPFAGSDIIKINDSVLIGLGAGNGLGLSDISNLLAIANRNSGDAPLIAGNFFSKRAGINIVPGNKIKATLHVRSGDFGPEEAANANADDAILESLGNVGITLRGPSGSRFSFLSAIPGDNDRHGLVFDDATGKATVRVSGADRFAVLSSGDAELVGANRGLILHSPDDSRFRVVVSNSGVVSAIAL